MRLLESTEAEPIECIAAIIGREFGRETASSVGSGGTGELRTGDVEWPDGTASRADAVDRAGGYTIKADQQRARDAD